MHAERRQLSIAYITPGLSCSGGIRIIFEHCDRLLGRGHSVYIASESQNPSQDWFPNLQTPLVHQHALNGIELDVIVATGPTTPSIVDNLNLPAKKFYFIQGKDILFFENAGWRHLADKTYRLPDFELIAVSQQLSDWLQETYGRDSTVITNGLNQEMFFPDPAIPKSDKPVVLIEGSFKFPFRGVAKAFSAAQGAGAEIWYVSTATNETPPASAVQHWHLPPQSMLRQIYSSADIFVNLSTLAGFLLPPLEAMACGCSVVVNNNPGGYAEDGVNCLMVEEGDNDAARDAIKKLMNDPELRKKLVRGGLNTVKENYHWDKRIDQLEQVYGAWPTSVMSDRQSPSSP